MAVARVQTPDGIMRLEVPEGTTPEQIEAFVAAQLEQSKPVDFDAGTMLKNIPSSGASYIKNMATGLKDVVMHPIDTVTGIKDLAVGEAQKAGRNIKEVMVGEDLPEGEGEQMASAFNQFLNDRYGSADAWKRTAMEDPVGMVGDLAMFTGPAGSASRIPGLAKAGAYVEPVTAAVGAGVKGVATAMKGAPEKLVGSAFKFPPSMKNRKKTINTILEHEVMPSDKGLKQVQSRLDVLNDELDRVISRAVNDGTEVQTEPVYQALQELRRTKGGIRIDADPDLAAIDEAMMGFMEITGARRTISPKEMLDFKRSVQSKVNWEKKDITKPAVSQSILKDMSKSSRSALDDAVPASKAINKEMADLLSLVGGREVLQSAIGRIQNHNLLPWLTGSAGAGGGLGFAIGGAGVGASAALSSAAITALTRALTTPASKAKTAFALKKIIEGDSKWINANRNTSELKAALALAGAYDSEDEK